MGTEEGLPSSFHLSLKILSDGKCGKYSRRHMFISSTNMSHLTRLPDDLLCSILQFLDTKSLLCEVSSVRSRLHEASLARGSWRVCNLTRAAHTFNLNGSLQKTTTDRQFFNHSCFLCLVFSTLFWQSFCFSQMPHSLDSPSRAGGI